MSVLAAPGLGAINAVAISTEDLVSAWRNGTRPLSVEEAVAIEARVAALRLWVAAGGVADGPSVMEAAAVARLVPSEGGPSFDAARFAELNGFLDHMPW